MWRTGDSSQFVLGTEVVEMRQWKKVLGVFRKYQLAHIPTNACSYCHKVVQPSVVRRTNHIMIRHHTEKMSIMSLAGSTFITIEAGARGEPFRVDPLICCNNRPDDESERDGLINGRILSREGM